MTEQELIAEIEKQQLKFAEMSSEFQKWFERHQADFNRLRAETENLEAIMLAQMQLITEISALADKGDVEGIRAKILTAGIRIGMATSRD